MTTEKPRQFWYCILTSGDGASESRVAFGKENARNELIDMMWLGPKEDALKDPVIVSILEEFDDEENSWSDNEYHCSLEQAHVHVTRITNPSAFEKAIEALKRITEACDENKTKSDIDLVAEMYDLAHATLASLGIKIDGEGI